VDTDYDMIQEFSQDIANQISDFIIHMVGSGRQRGDMSSHDQPKPRDSGYARGRTTDFPEVPYPHPSKRRRISRNEFESIDDIPSTPRTTRDRHADRQDFSRVEMSTSNYGHRGRTPGMPSLWSADELDTIVDRPRQPVSKKRVPNPDSRTVNQPLLGSRLRNVVSSRDNSLPASRDAKIATSKGQPSSVRNVEPNDQFLEGDEVDQSLDQEGYAAANTGTSIYPQRDGQEENEEASHDALDMENDEIDGLDDMHDEDGHEEEGNDDDGFRKKKLYNARAKWTAEEDAMLVRLYREGMAWDGMVQYFPLKTHNQIYYRWRKYLNKLQGQTRNERQTSNTHFEDDIPDTVRDITNTKNIRSVSSNSTSESASKTPVDIPDSEIDEDFVDIVESRPRRSRRDASGSSLGAARSIGDNLQ
jgi:hypothetical protein